MKLIQNGANFSADIVGPIGESTPLFRVKLDGALDLTLNMSQTTFINSIGVKNWILWSLRIPKNCYIHLINAPFVIASQASTVVGFMTKNMRIESFRVPYTCESCGAEESKIATRGEHYQYAQDGKPRVINLPLELPCGRCLKGKLEPDFIVEKTFKFLETT